MRNGFVNSAGWLLVGLVVSHGNVLQCAGQVTDIVVEDEVEVVEQIVVEAIPTPALANQVFMVGGANAQFEEDAAKRLEEELRGLISVELALAHRVCKLDKQQMDEIRKLVDSTAELSDEIVSRGGNAFRLNVGFANTTAVVAQLSNGQALRKNPIAMINESIARAITKVAGEAQAKRYRAEADARDAFRRSANIEAVLVILETKLALTQDQIVELKERLQDQWSGASLFNSEMYFENTDFVPPLPITVLEKVLTSEQLNVWSGFRKANFAYQFSRPVTEVRWHE